MFCTLRSLEPRRVNSMVVCAGSEAVRADNDGLGSSRQSMRMYEDFGSRADSVVTLWSKYVWIIQYFAHRKCNSINLLASHGFAFEVAAPLEGRCPARFQ